MLKGNPRALQLALALCVPFQVIAIFLILLFRGFSFWLNSGKLICGTITVTCTAIELVMHSFNGAIIGLLFYNLVFIGIPTLVSVLFLCILFSVSVVGKKKV